MEEMAPLLEFLPDAMALEAEWRANRSFAQKLEDTRAQDELRAPAAIFLRQARFALALRKLLAEKKISHLHATSSRALVCALILQSIVRHGESVLRRTDLSVSATIEPNPELPRGWIEAALSRCVGGRLSDRKLLDHTDRSFVLEPKTRIGLMTTRAKLSNQWAESLLRWTGGNHKSQITNQK